ncbi:MAG: SBBP repeat-containing protein, partial [Bacteroidota bacterium]
MRTQTFSGRLTRSLPAAGAVLGLLFWLLPGFPLREGSAGEDPAGGNPLLSSSRALDITVDYSGNAYVTGESFGPGSSADWATLKYSTSGGERWVERFDGFTSLYDAPAAIVLGPSSAVCITGHSQSADSSSDFLTLRYTSDGTLEWSARYDGPAGLHDAAVSLAADLQGYVYVTGTSRGLLTGDDIAAIRYNASGEEEWVVRYDGASHGDDRAAGIAVDGSGNVFVAGTTTGPGGGTDYVTLKYGSAGNLLWTKIYDGAGLSDRAAAVAVDAAGSVIVTGSSEGAGTQTDFATVKYTAAGVQQWAVRYNGSADSTDSPAGLAVDVQRNVIVAGTGVDSLSGSDYVTIKYNQHGTRLWEARYNGPGGGDDRP